MDDQQDSGDHAELLDAVLLGVKRVIVGQDRSIERLLVCLLANGHCLLEGVPGLAKTLAMETLATAVGGSFARIQFTPDLLPADIVGTRIYRASSERFDIELGPVFANFVLADEVNRAPAKVQSALLEVMAERQVSIGGTTYEVPTPFLVLATQNPIESDGVYPLPEAQRDRFLMKVVVGYPTRGEETEIVNRMASEPPTAEPVLEAGQLESLQRAASQVFIDPAVVEYAVNLVFATRDPAGYGLEDLVELIDFGVSPRATLGLVKASKALALLRGRDHVTPQDVFELAPDILRHRMVLSYEALAQNRSIDQVLARILSTVVAPRLASIDDRRPTPPPRVTPDPITRDYASIDRSSPLGAPALKPDTPVVSAVPPVPVAAAPPAPEAETAYVQPEPAPPSEAVVEPIEPIGAAHDDRPWAVAPVTPPTNDDAAPDDFSDANAFPPPQPGAPGHDIDLDPASADVPTYSPGTVDSPPDVKWIPLHSEADEQQ